MSTRNAAEAARRAFELSKTDRLLHQRARVHGCRKCPLRPPRKLELPPPQHRPALWSKLRRKPNQQRMRWTTETRSVNTEYWLLITRSPSLTLNVIARSPSRFCIWCMRVQSLQCSVWISRAQSSSASCLLKMRMQSTCIFLMQVASFTL